MERPSISRQYKTPKKIDYWFYTKTENLLREQIDLLKSEIVTKDKLIESLTNSPVADIEPPTRQEVKIHQPVGRVNPARMLAEMEAKDREDYWKKEIARREEVAKTEGNIIQAES